MAILLGVFWAVLLVNPLLNTGHSSNVNQDRFQKISSSWKSKLEQFYTGSVLPNIKKHTEHQLNVQSLLQKVALGIESMRIMNEKKSSLPNVQKSNVNQNRLSEFLQNISTLLQNQESREQAGDSWENILQPLFPVPAEKPRPTPALKLKDFLVSLRGSRNWDSLLSFIQSVLKLFSKDQTAVTFLMENWEILSGLVDTLFQALISGTLGQDSVTIQGVLCSLMGRSYCGFSTEWLQQLLHLFEGTNWKPMVHVQSGSSTVGHGRLRPFSLLPGALREKRSNLTQHPAEQNHNEMQSLLQIIYRSSERGKRVQSVGSAVGSDEPLWEGLEGLRQNLLRRVGRSVYGNVNKKVSRMTGSLVNRVSSVIGIPKSDQEGKCSAGNLQQLLLWGIKHNIKWNAETLGFSTRSFPSPPPMMTCLKSAGTVPGNVTEDYSAARSLSAVAWEEPWNADDVLEAVCNETIPGLPGISNFTIYLYCNLFNSTDYSNQPAPDLRTTCSDAAWYLAAADGDSLWVRVCREFFPEEFNLTVCTNSSLVDNQNYNQPLMEGLCSNWSQSFDEAKLYRNSSGCPETLHNPLLWDLIQNEENSTALEVLLQEYLQMPRDSFQKLLMSAENDAVKRFVSVMHRSWHRVQVTESDEQGLESLTSLLIQKFPHLTPQLFVDLSQFIPFMSISDILSLPTALLANESVLAAIKSHSSEMKFMQKRAFVKRLLVANTFGDVPSWPNYFLRAIQPLLPHLPLCHFMQLSPQQVCMFVHRNEKYGI
ncbi:hypothetical protein NDU88_005409 [Pleurodeles waltl]|uniref:Stereocilin LRR domain-containing protein n=1 Tax=Pleurodeles waltl TaxID=8319 RepID=A0AAV7TUR6_PLEWA|nr:hypothetical protein NDU88_005409 [Pleurodeles waltl]